MTVGLLSGRGGQNLPGRSTPPVPARRGDAPGGASCKAELGEVRFGETRISYAVIRSAKRKKTMQITIDPQRGVLVAVPLRATTQDIRKLMEKRAAWIVQATRKAASRPGPRELKSGESLPYLGRPIPLIIELRDTRRVTVGLAEGGLLVGAPRALASDGQRAAISAGLARWYSERAAEWLPGRVEHWASIGGYRPGPVLVRNQRRRWGSCGPDGTLRFNWRVMLAEPALVDYVIAHELAHLRVRNHSAQFWQEVARVMPDFRARRQRLRDTEPFLEM